MSLDKNLRNEDQYEDIDVCDIGGTGIEEEGPSIPEEISEPFDPSKLRVEPRVMTILILWNLPPRFPGKVSLD